MLEGNQLHGVCGLPHLPYLVNGLAVVKNQVQVQVMNQTRNSPPAWDHHPTLALWPNVWLAM